MDALKEAVLDLRAEVLAIVAKRNYLTSDKNAIRSLVAGRSDYEVLRELHRRTNTFARRWARLWRQ
jgi:hypothetical protein